MTRNLILGSLAGAASAAFVLTAASGPLGFVLSYLAPLPLFFAGLTHGFPAAALAGAIGTLISTVNGLQAAGIYLIIFALPVAVLVRQALLSRPAAEAGPQSEVADGLEWYPAGRLLTLLVGWAIGLFVLALLMAAGHEGGLPAALQPRIAEFLGALPPEATQGATAEGIDLTAVAAKLAKLIPAGFAVSWLAMMTINGTLAQGLAGMLKQNRRPSPRYSALFLPRFLAMALIAALLAGFVLPGSPGFIGGTVAAILAFPYLLQGLAVVHGVAARTAMPGVVLAAFYAVLVVAGALGGILLLLVAILGLIEEWAGFRRRLAGTGPSQETD
ncbi:MAG TPA: DUF2232 domain-containing protein [Ferrovibrio sp.]|jgi:hypothetical protein|uniref:DUF2232 domain-containing protein n=1 Tax=Ferrovibrio sp. TaxID=1917215 RepID=UPI002ED3A2D3